MALQPYERLILALADGAPLAQAAADAGLKGADAIREAKAFGWPDLDQIRQAASDLLAVIDQAAPEPDRVVEPDEPDELGDQAAPPSTPTPPREETPVPRPKPAPIPVEDDVAQALGGRPDVVDVIHAQHEARLATRNDEIPDDLDVVVDYQDQHEAPAMSGHGLDAAIAIEHRGTDALLVEDAARALQVLDRITSIPDPLDPGQRARVVALEEARRVIPDVQLTLDELLALADYIATGTIPVLSVRGAA